MNAYGANGGKAHYARHHRASTTATLSTIYRRDNRDCVNYRELNSLADNPSLEPPIPPIIADRSPIRAWSQLISITEGVTIRGTGARATEIGKIVAGKTGTTNDSLDAPGSSVLRARPGGGGVYRFDQPRTCWGRAKPARRWRCPPLSIS